MSQYPPPPSQPPYPPQQPPYSPYGAAPSPFVYAAPVRPVRPGIVTTLAVIGCIVGGLVTLCTPCGFLPFVVEIGPRDPQIERLKENKPALVWSLVSMGLNWVGAVLLLAGSIGAFTLRPWARPFMVIGAASLLVLQAVGLVLQFTVFKELQDAQMAEVEPELKNIMKVMTPIMYALMGLIALYLLSVIYFLTRPHIKTFFARDGAAASPGTYPPLQA